MQDHKDSNMELAKRVATGDEEARERMILVNLRLVLSATKPEVKKHPDLASDIIQEGTLGLIRAVEGYELNSGTKFSTYAYQWIKSGAKKAVTSRGAIKVPIAKQQVAKKLKDTATSNRISIDDAARMLKISRHKLASAMRAAVAGAVKRDSDGEVAVTESAEDPRNPEWVDGRLQRIEALDRAIASIEDNVATIVRMSYGLHPFTKGQTARQVAAALGIEVKEVNKLRRRGIDQIREILGFRPDKRRS